MNSRILLTDVHLNSPAFLHLLQWSMSFLCLVNVMSMSCLCLVNVMALCCLCVILSMYCPWFVFVMSFSFLCLVVNSKSNYSHYEFQYNDPPPHCQCLGFVLSMCCLVYVLSMVCLYLVSVLSMYVLL